jgi:hypothetical protein
MPSRDRDAACVDRAAARDVVQSIADNDHFAMAVGDAIRAIVACKCTVNVRLRGR